MRLYDIIWHAPENAHVQVLPLAFSEKIPFSCALGYVKNTQEMQDVGTLFQFTSTKRTQMFVKNPLSLSYIAATR